MYNDNYNCKVEETCCPASTEPMKAIIIDLNEMLTECRSKAMCIEGQLFGPRPQDPCKDEQVLNMYDAIVALIRTAKDTAEILYSINQRIEG